MGVDGEPRGGDRFDPRRAGVNVEGLIAAAAHEMMMVRTFGELIPYSRAGELHGGEPPLLGEPPDVPVDGCDTQTGHLPLAQLLHLFR